MRNLLLSVMLLAAVSANSQSWVRKFTVNGLQSMCFIDSTKAWAVGSSGIYKFKNNQWAKDTSLTQYNIVFFVDSTHGWALGSMGLIAKYDGKKWMKDTTLGSVNFLSVYFTDINHGWATAAGKIAIYKYGKWNLVNSPNTYNSIFALDTNHLWSGDTYRIFKGKDSTWSASYVLAEKYFHGINDIYLKDSLNGWAAGMGGGIYKYDNGTWSVVDLALKFPLYRIFFLNSNMGLFSGDGYVEVYTSGNWSTIKGPNGARDIYFSSPANGWLVAGDGIYKFDTTKIKTDIPLAQTSSVPEVYPNPAVDYITVSGISQNGVIVDIYDLSGTLVKSTWIVSSESQVHIGDVPAGLYIVKITDSGNSYCRKIIKQ